MLTIEIATCFKRRWGDFTELLLLLFFALLCFAFNLKAAAQVKWLRQITRGENGGPVSFPRARH